MTPSHLTILPIPILKDNYVWALVDTQQQRTWIVDPGEATPVNAFLKEHHLKLAGILITHHHWDHCNGITELTSQYSVPVIGPANDHVIGVTYKIQENDEIKMDHFPLILQVFDIPGHTLDHIAYYAPGILFCGDTLFAAGCGRVFEGTMEQMYNSLQKIASLPDDTKIYCAHEYTLNNLRFAQTVEPTNQYIRERIKQVNEMRNKNLPSLPSTLREEKATNPFLRCDSSEIIAMIEKQSGQSALNNPVVIFSWLRHLKDNFS